MTEVYKTVGDWENVNIIQLLKLTHNRTRGSAIKLTHCIFKTIFFHVIKWSKNVTRFKRSSNWRICSLMVCVFTVKKVPPFSKAYAQVTAASVA